MNDTLPVAFGTTRLPIIYSPPPVCRFPIPKWFINVTSLTLSALRVQYGAHSTATDSLRGGAPVLTLIGPDFAGYVARLTSP